MMNSCCVACGVVSLADACHHSRSMQVILKPIACWLWDAGVLLAVVSVAKTNSVACAGFLSTAAVAVGGWYCCSG